jgi:hypothetical protein
MPKSISAAQRGYDFDEGESKDMFTEVKGVFAEYGKKFLLNLSRFANSAGVVASGNLLKQATFRLTPDGSTMQIMMPDYFDYPNEGVHGVKSSTNAPGSPYRFKNYGMNEQGRKSIKDYINSGHAKIATVRKDKAFGIGKEKKYKSIADSQADQMIYLIKAYGVKKTNYFTNALNATFKDFEVKMSEAVGRDIVFTLEKLNRK